MTIFKKRNENCVGCFMGKKNLLATVIFFAAVAASFSKSLSFQILQKNDSLNSVCESALAVEDEILSYFFENGYIVSNIPAVVSKSDAQDSKFYNTAYNEAVDGMVDDFCLIKIYFTGDEKDNSTVSLGNMKKISWKVVSVKTGNVLEDSSSEIKTGISQNEAANVRNFASEFAMHIQKVINKKS